MIENNNFKQELLTLNPLSLDYKTYWREERRRCIEGYWVSGKWMPGPVYQYINHWKIELNKTKNSKQKSLANPFLRDLEWEKGRLFMEARGFSGFEYDHEYTCNLEYKDLIYYWDNIELKYVYPIKEEDFKIVLENKRRYTQVQYLKPRDYLQRIWSKDMGRPLMHNQAKNVVDIESRGTGKSFFASNLIAWNFLHDGVFWYDELRDKPKSETLIGAIDTKYSGGLIKKVQLGLDNLSGGVELNDKYYPPPFGKKWVGSWESGKTIEAKYEIKVGDSWVKKGSKSMIHHRSFADNPMAANGTRPSFVTLEEVGFMYNLRESLGQLKECTMSSSNKFGTIWMFGTGGDMAGGSTEAVKEVFYDTEAYDCLVFEDVYENKGKIGYFVPAWKGLNDFKDEQGNTNEALAQSYLDKEREKLKNGKSKQALYDELQNRPTVPSEAFLILEGNIFPVAELKEHLSYLENDTKRKDLGTNGRMMRDSDGKAYFKVDHSLVPCDYPTKESKSFEGATVIWEEPMVNAPYGLYIAGIDPYDQDKALNSPSLGSIFIYKRFINEDQTHDVLVAEYTARPQFANDFYEECRRLLEYYNAVALYENEKTGLKSYFETKDSLHLLYRQPSIIKTITPNSKVDRTYGTHMSTQIKEQIEIWTRDWLKKELSPGKMQLTNIYSIPLLKELISYNQDGNFDRVIAFMLIIMQKLDMHRIIVEEARGFNEIDTFFNRKLFR